jgi:hypothetical protein
LAMSAARSAFTIELCDSREKSLDRAAALSPF